MVDILALITIRSCPEHDQRLSQGGEPPAEIAELGDTEVCKSHKDGER